MRISTLAESGNWYKGNTHTHTTLSDGVSTPQQIAAEYRSRGYAFLAITDHHVYGVHSGLQTDSFLILPGVELDTHIEGTHEVHHVVGISSPGQNRFAEGTRFDCSAPVPVRELIDLLEQNGNVCIYAHPVWSLVSCEEYDKANPVLGMEIYNQVCERMGGTGCADTYYDRMLRKNPHAKCFASDDNHALGDPSIRGFIVVKAAELTHQAILDAIVAGSFYASTGPEIVEFYIDGDTAYIETSPCSAHYVYADNMRGAAQHAAGATKFTYKLNGGEKYLRTVCADAAGGRAWSQPIVLRP